MIKFSVIISIYHNDKTEYVANALDSVTMAQTIKPNEVVLVVDGPVADDLKKLILEKEKASPDLYNVIWLPENKGLGNALRVGVNNAKYELLARMDSDDISVPDRFAKQIAFMEQHPECDIVGGQIYEFIDSESNIVGKREVPCSHSDITAWMKKRCPFNHMSVMFRRSRILEVGNYLDWHYNEDYYLWIRMAEAGYQFANLPDTLVNVRVGKEMYQRRGGWKYFQSEKGLQDYMLKHKMISLHRYCYNVFGRFIIQVAMPNRLRGFIFQKLFRK